MQDETSLNEPISLSERLKSDENASERQKENPPRDSVYDFLYCDARRVASFLSQFESHGVAGQVRTSESEASTQTERKVGGGGLSIPGVAQAQTTLERTANTEIKDATEKTFDPFWKNARRLLDFLSSNGMIVTDIISAKIGQIVLAKGAVVIIDPSLIREAWEKPSFRAKLRSSLGEDIAQGRKMNPKEKDTEFNFFTEVMKMLPHTAQCHLVSLTYAAWATLSEDSLVSTPADLMLKHGAYVPGDWNMVGVMDVFPKYALMRNESGDLPDFDKMTQDSMQTPIASFMSMIGPVARSAMGRPENYYGITPLLIFREVSV
jgi:hypothetical protein